MINHTRFQDPIAFTSIIFQIKKSMHMAESNSKKHMSNTICQLVYGEYLWCN